MLIFGLSEHYGQSQAEIPSQWSKFVPHLGHISGQIGSASYGVISNSDESGACDYLCGVAVKEFPAHPSEFTRLRIPAQTYAVFERRDHISSIAAAWQAVWEHGLRRWFPVRRRTGIRTLRREIRWPHRPRRLRATGSYKNVS